MDKVYLVGGLDGKAFPSQDLAIAYISTFNSKLSIREINFIESTTPVEKINGCVLHFNSEKNFEVKSYSFNNLDNLPKIKLEIGYGKYSYRLFLPIAKKDLIDETIDKILMVSLPYLESSKWYHNNEILGPYNDVIKNIINGCNNDYMAKIMLLF